jgi:hypothetical protein
MNKTCVLIIFLFAVLKSSPQDSIIGKKKYFTHQLTKAITLDGIPSEEA